MAEKEYIERNAVVNGIRNTIKKYSDDKSEVNKITASIFQIFAKEFESIPAAVDVVEVVRCKDCIHYSSNKPKSQPHRSGYCLLNEEVTDGKREPNDFCSYGERKELDNG